MEIKIFQIDNDRDVEQVKFLGLDSLKKFQASEAINASIYDKVYEGAFTPSNWARNVSEVLEDVHRKFNVGEKPLDYYGHSLSVSDIVQISDASTPENNGFYFCDHFGFKHVEFEPTISISMYEDLLDNLRTYSQQAVMNHDNYIAEDLRDAVKAIEDCCNRITNLETENANLRGQLKQRESVHEKSSLSSMIDSAQQKSGAAKDEPQNPSPIRNERS